MLITTATHADGIAAAATTGATSNAATRAAAADVAAITTIVESVATYADRGEFEALERLYAPEVDVDYTSLAGGEPQTRSAQALMTEWASVLPGFDRTRHAISDVAVEVDGARARATARVVADHWIGALHWRVAGRYEYGLARRDRGWQITAHRFVLEQEQGTRDVFAPAMEAARAAPVAYLVRQQARQTVMDFLTGLEQKDMTRVNAVWAEDAVQEMPYVPAGFPSRVAGREALIRQYAAWPTVSGRARFTDGIRFYPTLDPSIVFVEYQGSVDVIPTGRLYEQRYGGLFHVQNGRITLFREYFDPRPFAHAFGLDEGRAFGTGQ